MLPRAAMGWELLIFEPVVRAASLLELAAAACRAFQVADLARRLIAQALRPSAQQVVDRQALQVAERRASPAVEWRA